MISTDIFEIKLSANTMIIIIYFKEIIAKLDKGYRDYSNTTYAKKKIIIIISIFDFRAIFW